MHGSGPSVPTKGTAYENWRVLPCAWHWSAHWDIICVRADTPPDACRASAGFRAPIRSSDNTAAPVAVPPSGVLEIPPTVERRTAATPSFKTAQNVQSAKRATPVTMRRHVVHRRSAASRETITRTTTVDRSKAATPSVVSTAAEQPRNNGIGYELFLSQFGKEKEAK